MSHHSGHKILEAIHVTGVSTSTEAKARNKDIRGKGVSSSNPQSSEDWNKLYEYITNLRLIRDSLKE